ncbi:MAG: DEAD/DEAH box helicase [Planctomycetes bacterium]|nr:DEAD/DEAH box helicase [Planctomycetota bacterium]
MHEATPDLSPEDVLGPGGLLATRMPAYESRPQQLAMARTVADAVANGSHAIVEAPTGVGKSFAYLVPLALEAMRTGRRLVVSTGTIALQEQLVRKDIPLLQEVFPQLKAVLVKGRQNYVSLRRMSHAADVQLAQQALFETREEVQALRELTQWAKGSPTGDKGDLGYDPPPAVWRQVVSDRNNCLGRKCPTYESCFFYNARREMEGAHLLIVNHHLYFSDLGLREDFAGILPPHDVVVFDEAHTLEDVATDHLGASVSEAQVRFFIDGLWSRKLKGLFGDERFAFAREAAEYARAQNEEFWKAVALLAGDTTEDTIKLASPHQVENTLSPALDLLAQRLDACAQRAGEDNLLHEVKAQQSRAVAFAGSVRAIISHGMEGHVYYAHVPMRRTPGVNRLSPSLSASPLSVADLLKERLFEQMKTVILTSATLAADDSERFLFLRKRLGLEGGLAQRLDSPFDFPNQVKLVLNQSPIDPNSPRYEQALAGWLAEYLSDPERGRMGGSFVLFTSYRQLKAVHDLVRPALDRANRFVLRHGDGMGRAQMLDLFKRVGDAVLFGTSSFWEGVDVPGDALRHVIITKLPFEVPNHPVVEARHHEITRRGGNAFMERSVPEAIIRLKQGFGRLIRTKNDTGSVVITDHRVLTKAYGRYFLKALPPCGVEIIELARYARPDADAD